MSEVRTKHPGYYGVLLGVALPWYMGLGFTFLAGGHGLDLFPSYRVVFHYVPAEMWGIYYMALGASLFAVSTIPRVPHRWVRRLAALGFLTTMFFLMTFVVWDVVNGVPPTTLIPPFLAMLLVEFRTVVEPESNPAWRRKGGS